MTADPRGPSRTRRRPAGEPPPLPREITAAHWYLLAALGVCALVWVLVVLDRALGDSLTRAELSVMAPVVDHRSPAVTHAATAIQRIGLSWLIPLVGWTGMLILVVTRRVRHAVILMVATVATTALVLAVRIVVHRPRPEDFEILGEWHGFSHPSAPTARLAVVLVVVTLATVPVGGWRTAALWATGVVLVLFGVSDVYLAVEHPTDALVGAIVGVAVASVLLGLFAPEQVFPIRYRRGRAAHLDVSGERTTAIRRALADQLGLDVVAIERIGLEGSAGSTPLRITVAESGTGARRDLFAKLYAQTHLRADRAYKLVRTLMYGRLEDERSFRSVRQLVEYEDYMLRLFRDEGIASAKPLGVVELSPEREYVLVTTMLEDARELSDPAVDVTTEMIDDALSLVRRLWDAGLAHRDIKPSNLMVASDRVVLVDVAFAQLRPSPWRQAVDLANMMVVVALRAPATLVYQRALRNFDDDEIAEAFAATRGVTLPAQVRSALRAREDDLVAELRRLAPAREPIRIQRFTWRRALLTVGVLIGGFALLVAFLGNLDAMGLI